MTLAAKGTGSRRRAHPLPEKPVSAELNPGDVAHDLANLVQVMGGNLELIAARNTDPRLLRYIENAGAAAEQLTELTRRLRGEDD